MSAKIVGRHRQRKHRKVVGYRPVSTYDHLGPLVAAACKLFFAKRKMTLDPGDFLFGRRK